MGIQGREPLLRKLAKVHPDIRKALKPALLEAGNEIANLQRKLAPQRTGALRRSIKVVSGDFKSDNPNVRGVGGQGRGDPDLTVRVVAGDAEAFYAAWVEFGTAPHTNAGKFAGTQNPGATPRPFFFPAYRALKKRVKSRITSVTRKAIKGVVSK